MNRSNDNGTRFNGKKLRILLWNELTIVDQLGAKLSHTKEEAAQIAMDLGEESSYFEWEDNEDGTISFLRKGGA